MLISIPVIQQEYSYDVHSLVAKVSEAGALLISPVMQTGGVAVISTLRKQADLTKAVSAPRRT